MIFAAFNIVLTLLAFRPVMKPVLTLLFMVSAGVAYFMSQYGVLIDAGMFRNFAETNATEVRDLLSLKLFFISCCSAYYLRGCCGRPQLIIAAGIVSY
ncbi:Phosphoethanolamine transferase EptA [compost metagenome]